jgi:hypothetical protein
VSEPQQLYAAVMLRCRSYPSKHHHWLWPKIIRCGTENGRPRDLRQGVKVLGKKPRIHCSLLGLWSARRHLSSISMHPCLSIYDAGAMPCVETFHDHT